MIKVLFKFISYFLLIPLLGIGINSYAQSCEYTFNVASSPVVGGVVTGSGTYECEESALLTAVPNEGYVFSGWYYDWEGDYFFLSFFLMKVQ